ncbi:Terminase small subunit [Rhizobium sp. CF122]|uniref:terminase small subunit n=1 Tax=Rhizobium sp. CF122 TaxID=1144312 RepID=UPI000271CAE7|nr:terminase small subunit [Rhizobium sp. CF122]EJL53925.1 Terminase small subunit [Rhizobium sp. CF122]
MPPLSNQRHEAFCRAISRGEAASRAYGSIYHAPTKTAEVNGSKLLRNPKVVDRIAELKGQAAKRTVKTVESLVSDLDETIAFARECRNPAAMVAAINAQARLLGLVVERSEVSVLHKPAPLPTRTLELSEAEWTAQFGGGSGPRPAIVGSKRSTAEKRKLNSGAVAAPSITWDADAAQIRARGAIDIE